MGATSGGHTQVTRFFANSSVSALEVGKILSMNVSQARGVADKALVFCNTTDNRSFASVVGGKCDRGFLVDIDGKSAGRSKVFTANTAFPVHHKQVHKSTALQSHKNGDSKVSVVKRQEGTSTGKGSNVHHHLATVVL